MTLDICDNKFWKLFEVNYCKIPISGDFLFDFWDKLCLAWSFVVQADLTSEAILLQSLVQEIQVWATLLDSFLSCGAVVF